MRSRTLLKERTPLLVALVVLIAMLGTHVVLRTKDDLSPWKGAGFAMFSTVDSPGMRTVAVWADVAGREERVALVGAWAEASHELRALPSPARTAALAHSVAASPIVRQADGSLATSSTPARPVLAPPIDWSTYPVGTTVPTTQRDAVEVRRIRVDVMTLAYDDGVVRAALLRSASADVAFED